MKVQIEVASDARAKLGEGPHWDPLSDSLYWVDIDAHEIRRYQPGRGDSVLFNLDMPVGSVVTASSGDLVAGAGRGVARIDGSGNISWLAKGLRGDRMNDGKCDPLGRFFVGSLTYDRVPGASSLYRLDAGGGISEVLGDVCISNGLGWSPDATTMYFIDTPARCVMAFDYDLASGALSSPRKFIDLWSEQGNPDGMAVDIEGGLWIAMCRSGRLRRHGADGCLDEIIQFPTKLITSCAFGGEGLDILFVTSGTFGYCGGELSDQPLAGALFALSPGISGLPTYRYGG